ncbi:hypothetical protein PM082_000219 [Marasmius tenuissimus]|nr:hypothetical protein PM082_000219 [Marasmius tenuissimus]
MMWPVQLVATVLSFAVYVTCNPLFTHHAKRLVYSGELQQSYDFIIIGGGQAGLTLASRLSEDSNTTVLVIEAGDSGKDVQEKISTPANTYFDSLTKSEYDWSYPTTSQAHLGDRAVTWPRGKVLGGSSAINGMYSVRPSEIEVEAWSALASDGGAAKAWSWNEFFKAMEKAESFSPPKDDIRTLGQISTNGQATDETGPIHTGFPGFMFDTVGEFSNALNQAGVATNSDPYSGQSWGGFVSRSFIDSSTWARSYSRSAYIDPVNRPNLSILVKSTVTRIVFDSNKTATGVEYAETRDGERHTVGVKKEVIVSAGAVGSPQVLMLSGVGPKDILNAANVPVQHELPGVGQHLQDHMSTLVIYNTTKDTSAKLYKEGMKTPEFLSFVNSAIAYVNTSYLFGDATEFQKQVEGQFSESLIPSTSPEVLAGAKAIHDVRAKTILPSPVGQIELLFGMMFADSMSIGVGIQQPFSQGRVYINSASAFDYPVIDPNYLAHPADKTIIRQGIKAARLVGTQSALSNAFLNEMSPGANVVSDEDIENWLVGQMGTEYHPSSSCAMLPQSKGGVVDPNLKVHGLNNVRVADASVFPFVFTAHLGQAVYGLAEQAANIIRAQHNGGIVPGSDSTDSKSGSGSGSGSGTDSGSSNPQQNNKNGASAGFSPSSLWTSVVVALAVVKCMMI